MINEISINGKEFSVYLPPAANEKVPIFYFISHENSLPALIAALKEPNCAIVTISADRWNDQLSPWQAEKVFKNGEPFGGEAGNYLREIESLLPAAEAKLGLSVSRRAIVGYSLAGLFALYALCESRTFNYAASISGSLWFPDFAEYVASKQLAPPDAVYFSVGDREKHTKSKLMSQVEEKTETIRRYFESLGTRTVFELNPGNHFVDSDLRVAKGISWLIAQALAE